MTTPMTRVLAHLPSGVRRLVPVELRADLRDRFATWVPGDLGFEPTAPPVRPEERTGPPDFVVLGPEETGAAWWLSCIADHPDVAPTRGAEAASHFFARYGTDRFGPADVDRFHALFPRRPGRIVGHWAADGLSYPWIAKLLAEAAPAAAVVVLVRDPIDLLVDRLAATADTRAPHIGSNIADAVDRGFFGSQLSRLLDHFAADRVLVLQVEQCLADPAGASSRTVAALGLRPVEDAPVPHPGGPAPPGPDARLAPATRDRLRAVYAADVDRLVALAPGIDLGRWPNFAPGA